MKQPETLQEAIVYFSDPERAFVYAVNLRWPNKRVLCPRCGNEVHAPTAWSSAWRCDLHGEVYPLAPARLPSKDGLDGLVKNTKVPFWVPWPLPQGWLVSGFTGAGPSDTEFSLPSQSDIDPAFREDVSSVECRPPAARPDWEQLHGRRHPSRLRRPPLQSPKVRSSASRWLRCAGERRRRGMPSRTP